MKIPKTRRFPLRLNRIAGLVGLLFLIAGCGDSCVGYSSFTDANGLIVLVACDGTTLVVTPTPAR